MGSNFDNFKKSLNKAVNTAVDDGKRKIFEEHVKEKIKLREDYQGEVIEITKITSSHYVAIYGDKKIDVHVNEKEDV